MLRIGILFMLSVLFCSCSNYLRKNMPAASVLEHNLNGTYTSMPKEQYRSYKSLTNDYRSTVKNVELTCLGKRSLQMRCTTSKDSVYTIFLKGKLQKESFRVKTKRGFSWFILGTFERDKYRFSIDQNKLQLHQRSACIIFLVIPPIMAAGERTLDTFERVK